MAYFDKDNLLKIVSFSYLAIIAKMVGSIVFDIKANLFILQPKIPYFLVVSATQKRNIQFDWYVKLKLMIKQYFVG